MDVLLLQIDVFVQRLGRPTQSTAYYRCTLGKFLFQNSLIYTDVSIQMAHFCPTFQTIQLATSHGFLLLCCATTLPHYPSSNSIKFTHPPTQTDSAGSISIWIATTFDVLVRYPWCSGCEKTQWLWDLKEKSAHRSSHTVRYPTSIYDVPCISGVIL